MGSMITYSQRDMQRQLAADQRLWSRVPWAVASLAWPLLVVTLGWQSGSLVALAAIALVGALSVALPQRISINVYLVDLVDRLLGLPLWLGWLILAWHLSAREPVFQLLGTPIPGAIAATVLALLAARLVAMISRYMAKRTLGVSGGA
jgi:hypothetical protein